MRGVSGPRPSDREMSLTAASCPRTHAGTHTSAHTRAHTSAHTCMHTWVHTHTHVHTRAHTHAHTETLTHRHTQISLQVPDFSPHRIATFQVGSHRGLWAVGNQHCPASPPDPHLRGS